MHTYESIQCGGMASAIEFMTPLPPIPDRVTLRMCPCKRHPRRKHHQHDLLIIVISAIIISIVIVIVIAPIIVTVTDSQGMGFCMRLVTSPPGGLQGAELRESFRDYRIDPGASEKLKRSQESPMNAHRGRSSQRGARKAPIRETPGGAKRARPH